MRTLFLSLLLSLYLSLFLHAGAADVRGQSVDITNWQPVRDMSNWPFSKSVYSQLRRCLLEGPKDRLACGGRSQKCKSRSFRPTDS